MCAKDNNTNMWHKQAIMEWLRCVNSIVAIATVRSFVHMPLGLSDHNTVWSHLTVKHSFLSTHVAIMKATHLSKTAQIGYFELYILLPQNTCNSMAVEPQPKKFSMIGAGVLNKAVDSRALVCGGRWFNFLQGKHGLPYVIWGSGNNKLFGAKQNTDSNWESSTK